MKKMSLICALFISLSSIAKADSVSTETLDRMQIFADQAEERFLFLDQQAEKNNSSSYSISSISIGYGAMDVGAGSGRVNVETNSAGKLLKVSVKAEVGMLGMESTISQSISIANLKAGKTLEFTMDGSSSAVMKITPQAGFGDFGGKAQIKINTTSGWKTENVEILRGQKTGKYFIWQGSNTVDKISINMRGYSVAAMKVGFYELE
jgi:hypothetical protein